MFRFSVHARLLFSSHRGATRNGRDVVLEASVTHLLQNRFVQSILTSALFLQLGIWIRNFAILLFVVEKTDGDPIAVSMISIAEFVPIFVFSFIGGAFADRWQPKRTMIGCELLSAASVFVVLIALLFSGWQMIFFTTLASAILSQFSQPSGMKLFKQHLTGEQMQIAMSLYQTIFAVFMVMGPILGTFVYQSIGIYFSIVITGLSFFLAAIVLIRIPNEPTIETDATDSSSQRSIWSDLLSGFQYVFTRRLLILLSISNFLAGLGIGFIHPLSVFLVTEQLHLPKEFLQWLFAANGIGMVLGGTITMMLSKWISAPRILLLGSGFEAIGMSIIGFSTQLWLTLIGEFICGLMLPLIQIGVNTTILQNTHPHYVGRVNGIMNPMFSGAMILTMSFAGWLKMHLPVGVIFQITAIILFLSFFVILPLSRLPMPKSE